MNVKSDTINFFPNNMSVPNQEFVNVTLYGNRVSVDVVKNLVMGRLYWIIQAGLKCDHMCPIGGWGVEGWAVGDCTHAERRQCEDGTERDFKILLLKSGVMSAVTRSWKRQGTDSLLEPPEEVWSCWHQHFSLVMPIWLLDFTINFCCFGHWIYANLLYQPQ